MLPALHDKGHVCRPTLQSSADVMTAGVFALWSVGVYGGESTTRIRKLSENCRMWKIDVYEKMLPAFALRGLVKFFYEQKGWLSHSLTQDCSLRRKRIPTKRDVNPLEPHKARTAGLQRPQEHNAHGRGLGTSQSFRLCPTIM